MLVFAIRALASVWCVRVLGYLIAATRAVSSADEERRLRVSGSSMFVISINGIFLAAYLEILSSSVTHTPGSAADVLTRRSPEFVLDMLSVVGKDAAEIAEDKRIARLSLRYMVKQMLRDHNESKEWYARKREMVRESYDED